jgi:hypothetical protein
LIFSGPPLYREGEAFFKKRFEEAFTLFARDVPTPTGNPKP